MSHHDAVSLITRQPRKVELELVETSGDIPYHVTSEHRGRFGSDSSESFGGFVPKLVFEYLSSNWYLSICPQTGI